MAGIKTTLEEQKRKKLESLVEAGVASKAQKDQLIELKQKMAKKKAKTAAKAVKKARKAAVFHKTLGTLASNPASTYIRKRLNK